jgi:HemY protein
MILRSLLLALVVGGVWFFLHTTAGEPGVVTLRWLGYEIQTSALTLTSIGLVLALIAFGLGEVYAFLISLPNRFRAKKWLKLQQRADETLLRQSTSLLSGDMANKKDQKQDQKLLSGPIADNPRNLAIRLQQAQLMEQEGDFTGAYALYEKLTAYKATSAVAQLALANLNAEQGEWTLALPQVTNYLKHVPSSAAGLDLLYTTQLALQNFESAWETLAKLRKYDVYEPTELDVHTVGLALHFATTATPETRRQAKQRVNEALKYVPGFWPLQEAQLLLSPTKNQAALRKFYAQAWQTTQRLDVFKLWFSTLKSDRPDTILKSIRTLTKKGQNKGQNWLCEGWALLELNQVSTARNALLKALEYAPNRLVYTLLVELTIAADPGPSKEREKYLQSALKAPVYKEPGVSLERKLERWQKRIIGTVPTAI